MATDNSILSLKHVSKNFQLGSKAIKVLNDINLDIRQGEFVAIVGASGCGKSTLLKLIISLEEVTDGEIFIEGDKTKGPSEKCNMIFQEPRLFPWLSAKQNIAFTISNGMSKRERNQTVEEHIKLVGLSGFEKAVPSQLSGGMQQRVNLARALATRPKLLLLDEPFGALDAFTRINMQEETLRIWESEQMTMLLVTHDIDEAIYLSDRIIVLSAKPGMVKADIPVELPRPRDRSSYDFMQIRRQVMLELFEKENSAHDFEYYI